MKIKMASGKCGSGWPDKENALKKTWPHTVHHSGKKCADCGFRLKANLVERKGYNSILRCYSCHVAAEAKRGHLMRNG
jgi:hypothetical protein